MKDHLGINHPQQHEQAEPLSHSSSWNKLLCRVHDIELTASPVEAHFPRKRPRLLTPATYANPHSRRPGCARFCRKADQQQRYRDTNRACGTCGGIDGVVRGLGVMRLHICYILYVELCVAKVTHRGSYGSIHFSLPIIVCIIFYFRSCV